MNRFIFQLAFWAFLLVAAAALTHCHTSKKTPHKQDKPVKPGKKDPPPKKDPEPPPVKPTPTPPDKKSDKDQEKGNDFSEKEFRIAFMLPFLGKQFDTMPTGLPEKSRLAIQFYAGAKLALDRLSKEEGMHLVVDVFDTNITDGDFDALLGNSRTEKADVYIGPVRSGHVEKLAQKTRPYKKILVSPESPNSGLTADNPWFIQLNPSLQSHCNAITGYVKRRFPDSDPVIVCKEKESERIGFFKLKGGNPRTLVMPDKTTSFDKTNLRQYLQPGKTSVFIMPSWSSQDFVAAFLRRLKSEKGKEKVVVFGMPQWMNFENIEPDFFQALNVHVTSDSYIDRADLAFKEFQQQFYDTYGTIPDEDGVKGYDCMLFVGRQLKQYGMDFPEKLWSKAPYPVLHGKYGIGKHIDDSATGNDRMSQYDYLENYFVHILKFDHFRFVISE